MSEKVNELYQNVASKSSDAELVSKDGDYTCPACSTGECLEIGCDNTKRCRHHCTNYATKMKRRPDNTGTESQ